MIKDLKNYNMVTLKSICKTFNIKNYSKLNKTDLIKHIKKNLKEGGGFNNNNNEHKIKRLKSNSPTTVIDAHQNIPNITINNSTGLVQLLQEHKNELIEKLTKYYNSYNDKKKNYEVLELVKDEVIEDILKNTNLYMIFRFKLAIDLTFINYGETSCGSFNNSKKKKSLKEYENNIINQKTCILWLYINNFIFFYKVILPDGNIKYNVLTNKELENYLEVGNKNYKLKNILKNHELFPITISKNNPWARRKKK